MRLIKACCTLGQFSPSFSELQRNFVKYKPTKLKSLLRLAKHWYLEVRRLPDGGKSRRWGREGKKRQEPDLSSGGYCEEGQRLWGEDLVSYLFYDKLLFRFHIGCLHGTKGYFQIPR